MLKDVKGRTRRNTSAGVKTSLERESEHPPARLIGRPFFMRDRAIARPNKWQTALCIESTARGNCIALKKWKKLEGTTGKKAPEEAALSSRRLFAKREEGLHRMRRERRLFDAGFYYRIWKSRCGPNRSLVRQCVDFLFFFFKALAASEKKEYRRATPAAYSVFGVLSICICARDLFACRIQGSIAQIRSPRARRARFN